MWQEIESFISNNAFAIVACCALFFQNMRLIDNHKKESEEITKALANNTIVISRLCDRLGVDYEDVGD